jgi:hypothetical protein
LLKALGVEEEVLQGNRRKEVEERNEKLGRLDV